MTIVGIYASGADRKFAYALEKKIKEYEPKLDISINSKSTALPDAMILIWSRRSVQQRRKWVPSEAEENTRLDRVFSVTVDGTPPPPFDIAQASQLFPQPEPANKLDLCNWTKRAMTALGLSPAHIPVSEFEFLRLSAAMMKAIGVQDRARFYEFRLSSLIKKAAPQKRQRRRYEYRELEDMSEMLLAQVQEFTPDSFFSFDARGGIWAQYFAEALMRETGRAVPVAAGFRLRRIGPRKTSPCFVQPFLETARWHLFIPLALQKLPETWPGWPDCRILYVDDYASSGDTCVAFRDYMVQRLGADRDKVKTLTLISTDEAEERRQKPDMFAHKTGAERADLFYMFRR